MPKFVVVHGSVALPPLEGAVKKLRSASIGEVVELTEQHAADLLSTGFITDEKTFAGYVKMIEGAAESGAVLPRHIQKLSAGLAELKAKRATAL